MTYSVVALRADHPLAKDNRFHTLGSEIIRNSMWQTRPTSPPTPEEWLQYKEQFRYAEIFVLTEYSSAPYRAIEEAIRKEFEAKMEEAKKRGIKGGIGIGGGFHPGGKPPEKIPIPEEYKEYDKVYFLNEAALQMYRDGGVDLDILKTISAEELPENCHRCMRGPYLPQNNPNS